MTDRFDTLFLSPKRGGILQSSGFLDLKSLMALNRTCKANMIDELSLILLIENEITRYHGVKTLKEAIVFWRNLCRRHLLKEWLERDGTESITVTTVTRFMFSDALSYEVMLDKMLKFVQTDSERAQLLSEQGPFGRTLLYRVAESGNPESLKAILALYPESERSKVVSRKDRYGWTALHYSAGSVESLKIILALLPECRELKDSKLFIKDSKYEMQKLEGMKSSNFIS